jgi:DNA-binding LytR/AlgR family response regulator
MITSFNTLTSYSINSTNKENRLFPTDSTLLNQVIQLPVCCKKSITVPWNEISHLEAISNYTMFYFKNGKKLLVSRTMKEFLAKLDAEMFVRVHKSFAINLHFLTQYDVKEEMFVQLNDGKKIAISRRKKKDFLEKTRNYFGNFMR